MGSGDSGVEIRLTYAVVALISAVTLALAQQIPQELRGRWVVERILPTSTVSCWDATQARAMIGTEIEYTADSLGWNKVRSPRVTAQVRFLTADEFHNEYSGGGANDSQVTFELGIRASKLERIKVDHPPASITGATTEIPGDEVFVKSPNTIVFSVCNVYFEARRAHPRR